MDICVYEIKYIILSYNHWKTNIMKAIEEITGLENALIMQSQRDSLRSELQAKSKFNQFDKEWEEKTNLLKRLDQLFFLHCELCELKLSKFGRL